MSDNVVRFSGATTLDSSPDMVLKEAMEAGLKAVVVIGFDADDYDYFLSSMADAGGVLWHLERAKWRLMRTCDKLEGRE